MAEEQGAHGVELNVDLVEADPKYGQLPKDIVDILKTYEHEYFREDKPIPFCGLTIYPIQVRYFEPFSNCLTCFTLNKNEDPKGIALSHLDYLISKTQIPGQEGKEWSYRFQRLLEMVFHIENGLKCTKCGHVMKYEDKTFVDFMQKIQQYAQKHIAAQEGSSGGKEEEENLEEEIPKLVCPCEGCDSEDFIEMIKIIQDPSNPKRRCLSVDGQIINRNDFNKLRQIVPYQNFYDYVDDSWVDPEVKKDHDEKIRLEQQRNDVHASIEKKVICLSIATHYSFEECYNMPIRKFTMALATVDDLINYKIMKQAVSSGFVSLPKGKSIEHWIYKPNKDMYGDAYKSTDEVQQQVSNL